MKTLLSRIGYSIVFGAIVLFSLASVYDNMPEHMPWSTQKIVCGNEKLTMPEIHKKISELITSGQISSAAAQVERLLSYDCRLAKASEDKFSALSTSLRAFKQAATEVTLANLLLDSKQSDQVYRAFLINAINEKHSATSNDIVFGELDSFRLNSSPTADMVAQGKLWEEKNELGSIDGPTWIDTDAGSAAVTTAPNISAGLYLFGIYRSGQLKDWFRTEATSSTYFVGNNNKLSGWIEIEPKDMPNEIDQETPCNFQIEFFSLEPSGYLRRFNIPIKNTCVKYAISPRDIVLEDKNVRSTVASALTAPPIFLEIVDFKRRDDGDKAIVASVVNHSFGILPLLKTVFEQNFRSALDPNGRFDRNLVGPESCKNSNFLSSLTWALPSGNIALERILPIAKNIDLHCAEISSLASSAESIKRKRMEAGIEMQTRTIAPIREMGPNDNVNFGLWRHIYVAADLTNRSQPEQIIIKSQANLKELIQRNRTPFLNLKLIKTDPDIRIYQGGFWSEPKSYIFNELLINEISDLQKEASANSFKLDRSISELRTNVSSLYEFIRTSDFDHAQ